MNSQYSILFQVNFRHAYFAGEIPDCFSVRPTADTDAFLLNQGMLFKSRRDGFAIAFESYNNGQQYTAADALAHDHKLTFVMGLSDPLFFNYTDVIGDIANSVFLFRNNTTAGSLVLHASEYVGTEDLVKLEELGYPFFRKPFALIELHLNTMRAGEYAVQFREKSTYWRYLLVSDHLRELQRPAVLNGSVVFNGPVEIELPGNKRALAFESEQPLSISQRPGKNFQLVENYDAETNKGKAVIKMLPHPDVNCISRLGPSNGKYYSEIFI